MVTWLSLRQKYNHDVEVYRAWARGELTRDEENSISIRDATTLVLADQMRALTEQTKSLESFLRNGFKR